MNEIKGGGIFKVTVGLFYLVVAATSNHLQGRWFLLFRKYPNGPFNYVNTKQMHFQMPLEGL